MNSQSFILHPGQTQLHEDKGWLLNTSYFLQSWTASLRNKSSSRESHKPNIMAYRQHIIKKLTVRLKGRMKYGTFPSPLLSGGLANWVALTLNSIACVQQARVSHTARGSWKRRASFYGAWWGAKSSVSPQGTLPLQHGAPSPALRGPARCSSMCWVEVEAPHCKQGFQVKRKKKTYNRRLRFYIRIQVLAIQRTGKKKK